MEAPVRVLWATFIGAAELPWHKFAQNLSGDTVSKSTTHVAEVVTNLPAYDLPKLGLPDSTMKFPDTIFTDAEHRGFRVIAARIAMTNVEVRFGGRMLLQGKDYYMILVELMPKLILLHEPAIMSRLLSWYKGNLYNSYIVYQVCVRGYMLVFEPRMIDDDIEYVTKYVNDLARRDSRFGILPFIGEKPYFGKRSDLPEKYEHGCGAGKYSCSCYGVVVEKFH